MMEKDRPAGYFDAPPMTLEELTDQYEDWCFYRDRHVTEDTPHDARARLFSDEDAVVLLHEMARALKIERP